MTDKRKLTDAELNQYIADLQKNVAEHLDAIQHLVPPGFYITLVVRHHDTAGAGFVMTKDKNLEAVANEVLGTSATLKSVDGTEDVHNG